MVGTWLWSGENAFILDHSNIYAEIDIMTSTFVKQEILNQKRSSARDEYCQITGCQFLVDTACNISVSVQLCFRIQQLFSDGMGPCPNYPGFYRLLDGAHRWNAYMSTGMELVIVIIKDLDGSDPLLYAAIGPKQFGERKPF